MLIGGGNSQSVFSAFSAMNATAVATLRRKRRSSTIPNPKKMFDEVKYFILVLLCLSYFYQKEYVIEMKSPMFLFIFNPELHFPVEWERIGCIFTCILLLHFE